MSKVLLTEVRRAAFLGEEPTLTERRKQREGQVSHLDGCVEYTSVDREAFCLVEGLEQRDI